VSNTSSKAARSSSPLASVARRANLSRSRDSTPTARTARAASIPSAVETEMPRALRPATSFVTGWIIPAGDYTRPSAAFRLLREPPERNFSAIRCAVPGGFLMGQPVVLLVHYDPRQVRSLQGALESNGFAVRTCTDGEAALKAFPELLPDVVVVEAMIPRRNGFEVCKALKGTEAGRRTPVVITSGVFRSVKHRTEAVHTYGCQEFLGRGFSPADLVTA